MILIDSSVWANHFRHRDASLQRLLQENTVVCHPLIIGELACGYIKNRGEILRLLSALPQAKELDHKEVLYFIEHHGLMGIGIGFIDMHLLASAVLTHVSLWTFDKALAKAAQKLHLSYSA